MRFFILSLLTITGCQFVQKTPEEKPAAPVVQSAMNEWCKEVRAGIEKYKWAIEPCEVDGVTIPWKEGGKSVQGRPLVYSEFGDLESKNITLIFSTVHGDEVTPLYLGLQIARWLTENRENLAGTKVVLAPLVNPDGFFRSPPTRVNSRGVDVNRNFLTKDWNTTARDAWKKKFKGDPRRNPGKEARSEPETIFQEELISRLRPQKILSIHSPLNFTDYDGPSGLSLTQFSAEYVKTCIRLKQNLKATPGGFYPGSLGNYAGQELGIPTITLELPSADPKKAHAYWLKFSEGIRTMIEFTVPDSPIMEARNYNR
jgi:murein peptide amidase A